MTGILQLPTVLPAQVGINPNTKKMVSTDNLTTILTPGYLNQVDLQSNPVSNKDVIELFYNYNQQTGTSNYGQFSPLVVNGIITLLPASPSFTGVFNLTQAQILGMFAASVQLVPAIGAAYAYIVTNAQIITNVSTVFAGGGSTRIQYGSTAAAGGTLALYQNIASTNITASASQVVSFPGIGITAATISTGISNMGLYLSNATGAFTGGAGSSVNIIMTWITLPAII